MLKGSRLNLGNQKDQPPNSVVQKTIQYKSITVYTNGRERDKK